MSLFYEEKKLAIGACFFVLMAIFLWFFVKKRNRTQHIHGKNFQDYPEWLNAVIFWIILKILEAIPRQNNSLGFHQSVN